MSFLLQTVSQTSAIYIYLQAYQSFLFPTETESLNNSDQTIAAEFNFSNQPVFLLGDVFLLWGEFPKMVSSSIT